MSLNIHPVIRAVTLGTLGACVCVSAPQPFDYYVFALSWSPEYCASGNSTEQCTGNRRYGFVVHGLWPQYERGGYPANCAGPREVPRAVTDAMLELMPSRELIRHE